MEEVIEGCLLKLKVQNENVKMLLINVYAPCNAAETLHVLSVLCDTVGKSSTDEFLFVGVIIIVQKIHIWTGTTRSLTEIPHTDSSSSCDSMSCGEV